MAAVIRGQMMVFHMRHAVLLFVAAPLYDVVTVIYDHIIFYVITTIAGPEAFPPLPTELLIMSVKV
jgi:hypothetical protein